MAEEQAGLFLEPGQLSVCCLAKAKGQDPPPTALPDVDGFSLQCQHQVKSSLNHRLQATASDSPTLPSSFLAQSGYS